MKFSGHAIKRLRERYGVRWTAEIEKDIAEQWRLMKGRDPDPRTDGRGCIWYTFTTQGVDVRILISVYDKIVVTCGPTEFLENPLLRGPGKKLKRRGAPRKLDNRKPAKLRAERFE